MVLRLSGPPNSHAHATPDFAEPHAQLEPLAIPFKRFFGILKRRAWVIVAVTLIGAGAVGGFLKLTKSSYTASTSVLVEPRRTQVADLQAITTDPGVVATMRTQIDILRSPSLLLRVVEEQKLTENPDFAPGPGLFRQGLDLLRGTHEMVRRLIDDEMPPPPPMSERERTELAATILADRMTVANEVRSNVLGISVTTSDPVTAAAIANEIANQFLEFKRHQKFAAMQRAHQWFQERLAGLSERAREAEAAVEAYRQRHNISEVPAERIGTPGRIATINRQQLNDLSRELITVSSLRAQKESQLNQIAAALRTQGRPDALPEVLNSQLVARMREQEATLISRLAEVSSIGGDRSPDVISVRAQLAGLQRRIREEMNNILTGLRTEVNAIRAREQSMQQQLETLRSAVAAENSAEVGLQGLMAEAQANRAIYESFLNRATQLANSAGIQDPDAELVSAATPPISPSAPRRLRLLAVGALLSLVAGVALACILERLRGGLSTPDEVEACIGVRPLGLVPSISVRNMRALTGPGRGGSSRGGRVTAQDALTFTAALDRVRGLLQAGDSEMQPKVVVVTSSLPEEGKSFLSISLARSAASAGRRVLLIDADMRRPSIAQTMKLRKGHGLHDVLSGVQGASIDTAIQQVTPQLHVLQASSGDSDPLELLAGSAMSTLLDSIEDRYDLILVDTPPVLPVADALVLARLADVTLLAVRWESTPRAVAREAMRLLRTSGARSVTAVITQVEMKKFTSVDEADLSQMYRRYPGYYSNKAA